MKKTLILLLALAALGLYGCDEDDCLTCPTYGDNGPPPVPQGVFSITGDEQVFIYWNHVDDIEGDFDTYVVYRSFDQDTGYLEIGTTGNDYFVDNNVNNGQTYYYAVSSMDLNGYLSDLSYENVFDTPRPEGYNQRIYDFNTAADSSGWDLSGFSRVAYNSINADFNLEYFAGNDVFYINVANVDTDIQDMGFTDDLDEINYSPVDGWSYLGWVEVILGHTYIIWTDDNHFAKVRITAIDEATNSAVFDWAYQVDWGNPELKPFIRPSIERPDNYLRMANQKNSITSIAAN